MINFARIPTLTCRAIQRLATKHNEAASNSKNFRDVPQPARYPILGTALEYSSARGFDPSDLGKHWIKRHQQLGPIYKENVLPGITEPIVYCSSPTDTEKLFRGEEICPFREPLGPLQRVRQQLGVPNGLTNSNEEEWREIRRVVNPLLLNNEKVWRFAKLHHKIAVDFVDYIQDNLDDNSEVPHLSDALNRWAFEGIGLVAFGRRLGAFGSNPNPNIERILNGNNAIMKCLGKMLYSLPLWKHIDTKDLKILRKAHYDHLEATEAQINEFVKSCSDTTPESCEVLNGIWSCTHLSKSAKVMLLTEFLTAGIDTTSNCVAFFLYALSKNENAQEKLRHEITTAIDNKGVDGKIISQLPYLNAFTKEVQRMFPFVSSNIRKFSKEKILSGYRIPARTLIINTSNTVNSRNPEYFENPNEFFPERWLTTQSSECRQKTRFIMSGPFGLGARMCPGRKLAMQEVQLLLAAILSRYRVEYHHRPITVKFRLVSFPSEQPRFKFTPL